MRPTRVIALPAALVLAALALLAGAGSASAAPGDQINSFNSAIDVNANGTFHVQETISYTFAGGDRHGIYRTIPVVYPTSDKNRDRVTTISDVTVSSPTGAPSQFQSGGSNGSEVLKIGDPNQTVSGTETYVIGYTVRGALNQFPDHVELYWNVTGNQWDAPIARATARVVGPAAPTQIACFEGSAGSSLPCARSGIVQPTPGSSGATAFAAFAATSLDANQGLTVVVGYPLGSVTVPPPVLRERWSIQRAFSVRPLPLGLAVLTLLGGLFGVGYVVWSRGRDRRYVGEVPGLTPVGGQDGPEERKPLVGGAPVVVDFTPPKDVRPGEAGTLIDESADVLDVTATIVDLAVRRYLKIDETGEKRTHFTKRDWTLTKLKDAGDELKEYERTLFDALFKGRTEVSLSELKQTFATDLAAVQTQLYVQVMRDGWFRRRPDSTRAAYGFFGLFLAALGGALTYVLARWTHFGLVGIAAVFAGLAMLWAGRYMPARTGRGSAALAQLLGFRQYLRTAEAEQIRFEEREEIFSRYLPYAIIFGETERWAKTFSSLASAGAVGAGGLGGAVAGNGLSSLYWYGMLGGGGGFTDFNESLSSFTASTAGSIAAAAPSGGSGFGGVGGFGGGGFSGGGFGGGGGGSW